MNAAMYLRSSKDRSDVSIAAQRHELDKLATARSLKVVKCFEDAVESGATEDRPGFLALIRSLKDPHRSWSTLLVYDTSRIARRRHIAQAIKHQAKKHGVTILYARMPTDLDPVSEIVLESVFEAMDEAHSIMSREKGLAGMSENVRQGWRAGGRAPFGYGLESHPTGAIRDGQPVTKSKLVPNADAPKIRRYLKDRAAGVPRTIAQRHVPMNASSLVGVEWNALTYAGHTVWNRHAAAGTGHKRRPRSGWQMTRETHRALITDAEAETILTRLETSRVGDAVSRAKASTNTKHLLAGLLCTPECTLWVGHGTHYRLKRKGERRGKLVPAALVEQAVLGQLSADMASDAFLSELLTTAKRFNATTDPAAPIAEQIRLLEKEKARAAELAISTDDEVFIKLVAEKSRHIEALQREMAAVRKDNALADHVAALTVEGLRDLLAEQRPEKALDVLVERVVLDPEALTCQIEFKAVPGERKWLSVASPRGFEPLLPP